MKESPKRVSIPLGWGTLREGWYLLECGGISLDDPGPASVGYVLRYPNGRWAERRRKLLPGVKTQDEAEFEAVFRGLQFARRRGARRVAIQTSSDLVVKQLNGNHSTGWGGWRSTWKGIERLLKNGFDAYLLCPISREQNKDVYALAQNSLDRAMSRGRTDFFTPLDPVAHPLASLADLPDAPRLPDSTWGNPIRQECP